MLERSIDMSMGGYLDNINLSKKPHSLWLEPPKQGILDHLSVETVS